VASPCVPAKKEFLLKASFYLAWEAAKHSMTPSDMEVKLPAAKRPAAIHAFIPLSRRGVCQQLSVLPVLKIS
jgi:hypothetical protein